MFAEGRLVGEVMCSFLRFQGASKFRLHVGRDQLRFKILKHHSDAIRLLPHRGLRRGLSVYHHRAGKFALDKLRNQPVQGIT